MIAQKYQKAEKSANEAYNRFQKAITLLERKVNWLEQTEVKNITYDLSILNQKSKECKMNQMKGGNMKIYRELYMQLRKLVYLTKIEIEFLSKNFKVSIEEINKLLFEEDRTAQIDNWVQTALLNNNWQTPLLLFLTFFCLFLLILII